MKIGTIGYNYSHKSDFVMDRPHGNGACLLLLIKEPAVFEIGGVSRKVKKNSFVFFTPETPCKYHGDGDTYTDDWMYCSLEDGDTQRLQGLGIPFNEVVHLGRMDELSRLIHILAYEHYSAEPNQAEIERHYVEIFLLKLSSLIQLNARHHDPDLAEKNHRFTRLRNEIYTIPEMITNVDCMAEAMHMSRSGFQHLYKKIFGVSVMQDIMNSRVSYAKQLLSESGLSIRRIAEKCGYTSEYSFMRQFKKQTGKTPSEYRASI
ncbi:MAG: helix-turn-helix transcriptional regulator [Ruminococcus sp.]|nr:helix-turn-helix transcriptional regulator [Ruminococcus sp.]